jgi:hypothetical protein
MWVVRKKERFELLSLPACAPFAEAGEASLAYALAVYYPDKICICRVAVDFTLNVRMLILFFFGG